MSEFSVALKREFSNFPAELVQRFRDDRIAKIENACDQERENNIATATTAMVDAGLTDEVITQMLQKYWDLRLSETAPFLKWAHRQLKK